MRNQKLTDKYVQVVENAIASKKTVKESPQTMPAPVKPGVKPTTTPSTPTTPAKPRDPFFPKPGQAPRPKAVKVIKEEETCAGCGEPVDQCKCAESANNLETEADNRSLQRFVAKRTHYKQ